MSLAEGKKSATPSSTIPFQLSNNTKCTLMEDYRKFFKEQQFCDVQFSLGTEEVKIMAHIAFVAARSEYLRKEILAVRDARQQKMDAVNDSSCLDKQEPLLEVRLPNANLKAFKNILHYIYTDRIDLMESHDNNITLLIDIYELADLYLMQNLKDCCLYYLEDGMNLNNAVEALNYADYKKIQIVKDICLKFLDEIDQEDVYDMLERFSVFDKHLLLEFIRIKLNPKKELSSYDDVGVIEIPDGSLKRDMAEFFDSTGKDLCDIDLLLDGQVIKAHKSILAARATYFQAKFSSVMRSDNKINISIVDILPSVKAFQALLRYIYYGKTEFPPQDALYLLQVHNFYGLSNNHLHSLCRHYLEKNITYKNVLQTLKASDKTSNIEIKEYALKLIAQDFARVARLPNLSILSRELLLEVITSAYP